MKASKFIVATAALVAAVSASAFAADAPASTTAAAATSIAATTLNVPSITISGNTTRDRAEVKAEAVEAAKHHHTALADQLDQYKN